MRFSGKGQCCCVLPASKRLTIKACHLEYFTEHTVSYVGCIVRVDRHHSHRACLSRGGKIAAGAMHARGL